MKEEAKKKDISTNTAFYLMFPTLILAGIATYFARPLGFSIIALAIAIYQLFMLGKFIQDYYRR